MNCDLKRGMGILPMDSRYAASIGGMPPIQQSRERKGIELVSLARVLISAYGRTAMGTSLMGKLRMPREMQPT